MNAPHLRYMRTDRFALDDPIGCVVLSAPDRLTAAELADVRTLFDMRLRAWERHPFQSADASTGEPTGDTP